MACQVLYINLLALRGSSSPTLIRHLIGSFYYYYLVWYVPTYIQHVSVGL